MHVFSKNENVHFSPTWGPKPPKNGSFFVIFGCGASELKDGLRELNETLTQCVIDSRDDARLFGK